MSSLSHRARFGLPQIMPGILNSTACGNQLIVAVWLFGTGQRKKTPLRHGGKSFYHAADE